jgi:peroxiredoxin
MATASDRVVLGSPAGDFQLRGTDERIYSFDEVAGERGTVIMFICNHCPYVKAVIDRVVQDALALQDEGVGFAAICSNDATAYPEDSFENMKAFGRDHRLPFPYLHDEDQSVALAYGAVCTPDFFGYDREGRLRYHGRLDEGRTNQPSPTAPRELLEAMRAVAATGIAPAEQKPSMGCSIKWKPGL